MTTPTLTKAQQDLKNKLDKGIKINRINGSYRFDNDGSLCNYKTFWNLMRTLYGIDESYNESKKYFNS